jgi:hypothetical protein
VYRERKLGTDDYARDAKRVRDNAIEWIKRAVEAAEAGNDELSGSFSDNSNSR